MTRTPFEPTLGRGMEKADHTRSSAGGWGLGPTLPTIACDDSLFVSDHVGGGGRAECTELCGEAGLISTTGAVCHAARK